MVSEQRSSTEDKLQDLISGQAVMVGHISDDGGHRPNAYRVMIRDGDTVFAALGRGQTDMTPACLVTS